LQLAEQPDSTEENIFYGRIAKANPTYRIEDPADSLKVFRRSLKTANL
jgi:hypothetical protein